VYLKWNSKTTELKDILFLYLSGKIKKFHERIITICMEKFIKENLYEYIE